MSRFLLLDLGNSRCKLAGATAGTTEHVVSVDYGDDAGLQRYLAEHAQRDMAALASQVVSDDQALGVLEAVQAVTGRPVRRIQSTDRLPGVCNGYLNPAHLGVDRLLAMVAARARFDGGLCVVDVGTAVTIDVIDAAGTHQGGVILPGEHLARRCLFANTSIPQDGEIDKAALLGRDTATAVSLGARYAVVSAIERIVDLQQRRSGERIHIVVSGGGSDSLMHMLPSGVSYVADLVLGGLALVAADEED